MFQMKDVGRKIATHRKEKNMTQMELADAMGVSFQAVSNWERGNSMPDISKLPELSTLLGMSIDELLTDEEPAKLVQHILDGDEKVYIQERSIPANVVADVAPILKPDQTEDLLGGIFSRNEHPVEFEDLVSIAPYVSEDFLHEWALKVCSVDTIKQLSSLAPYLREDTLDKLVDMLSQENVSVRELTGLAPFLSESTLNKLAERTISAANIKDLTSLAPFLSDKTLDNIIRKACHTGDVSIRSLVSLAPFLSDESMDWLASSALNNASPEDVVALAPYMSKATLQRCADGLLHRYGVKGIKGIAPFL